MNHTDKLKRDAAGIIAAVMIFGSVGCTAEEAGDKETAQGPEQTVTADTSGTSAVYDTSVNYGAVVMEDGEALTGGTYEATGDSESAVDISGTSEASLTGSVIIKSSGKASSADDASFRGINSAVRAWGSSVLTLRDCTVKADAENATGVFSYDGATVYIYDSVIDVTGGGAGGVQVAGGGTLIGEDLTVTSESKAAIRSDRGGGTIILDGGSYTSKGSNGCPAIYSTADITVSNAECVSVKSRAVIIEGKNSVTLDGCTLSGNDQSTKEGSVRANVLIYQSASGDASEGTGTFIMNGGSMTCLSGAMFYVTNTSAEILLSGTELTLSEDGTLLTVSEGRWGREGRNGGEALFSVSDQDLEGDIYVDSISSLEMKLSEVNYTGCVTGEGSVSVELGSGSTWKLTGDSYITSLTGDTSGIDLNGHALYVGGEVFSE